MQPKELQYKHQDGTSQDGRYQKALDPEYVLVDERSIRDLLDFARKYSGELKYFNERNEPDGDWSGFLEEKDLDAIVEYMKDPGRWTEDGREAQRQRFQRPHLVLFLTFLELLQHARAQLNGFTRKHLEFYYREALRLTARQGQADQVHVAVELVDGEDQFLLPAGTVFQAGQDSMGNDLFYRSDEDFIANQAVVESVKTLYVQKKTIGIHEARKDPDGLADLFPQTTSIPATGSAKDRAFLAMLVMALGEPRSGGNLPPYPKPRERTVDPSLLGDLDRLLHFIPASLYMPLATFRLMMELRNGLLVSTEPEKAINQQWKKVNEILEKAGRERDPRFRFNSNRFVSDDFEGNLLSALNLEAFEGFFDGLADVDDIYDVYRWRERPDVREFIVNSLFMKDVGDFEKMMREVEDIHERWRQIYAILRAAGRKKQTTDPGHQLGQPDLRAYDPNKFGLLIQSTLGTISFPTFLDAPLESFDDCYNELSNLERYFQMPAEKFAFIRAINEKQDKAQPWEWAQAYKILEDAYSARAGVNRQNVLKAKQAQGFDTLIRFVLGHPEPGYDLPESKKFEDLEWPRDQEYINNKLFLAERNFKELQTLASKGDAVTVEEWARACAILEPAQRIKRNIVDRAQIENWENIYAAPDASKVQEKSFEDGETVTPRWRTFGAAYFAKEQSPTLPGNIGFAIASPLLALSEGVRNITLLLRFAKEGFNQTAMNNALTADAHFHFHISTEKEMMKISKDKVVLTLVNADTDSPGLKFEITLDSQIPPIVPPPAGTGVQAPWPVLQIMLADIFNEGRLQKQYRVFQSLKLENIHLSVKVNELNDLILQDDESAINPKKPFEPFGRSPAVGASFYIAHTELCSKKLDELVLTLEWLGAPDDLFAYYDGYKARPANSTGPIKNNKSFTAQLRLYDQRSLHDIKSIELFHTDTDRTGASKPHTITLGHADITRNHRDYRRVFLPVTPEEVVDWDRYWQIELLAPDFQHAVYPTEVIVNNQIKPPYTPKIKKLKVGYTASLQIDLRGDALRDVPDQLYHVEPFGYRILTSYNQKPYSFLPQYENEGELFIGVKNLVPPRNLSLLFQLADGSADPDVERGAVHWSFLSGNQWHSLEQGRILGDSTDRLLNSGIIKFNLPAVEPSTLLPTSLYWIRATVAKNSRSIADTVAIRSQAVRATFEDRENAPDHLSQPLPPESIKGPAEAQPEIRAIHQPFSSFGGKSAEPVNRFYTRVSERLRHKDRALTIWDYEHMVLEAFPTIYKVKCLPAGTSQDPGMVDIVQVIVIPDIRGKLPFDPFEPKAPANVLRQIEEYLIEHSPPFSRLQVKNPAYMRLKVRLSVRFREGSDPGYYKSILNRELQRYLAPWAYDDSADILFGNTINASLLVNFVEERPYIDYVAGLKLFITVEDETPPIELAPDEEFSFDPGAILVSDRSHEIDLITEERFEEQFFSGIGYLKIELDFRIE